MLANHGYLNRNGVTTLTQGIDAIGKVFGVEADLGLALNAYAVVFNGNILDTTWSIGGKYASDGLGGLTNLLFGEPAGINAHNIYEGDASIVRQDYYLPGANHDNVKVHLPYFQELLDQGGNNSKDGEDVFTPTVSVFFSVIRDSALSRTHLSRSYSSVTLFYLTGHAQAQGQQMAPLCR